MKYIIATHGELANGFSSAVRVIIGNEEIYTVNAYVDGRNDVTSDISAILDQFDPAERVLVFTDVLGGSVNQEITALMERYNMKVITGMNLCLVMDIIMQGDRITDESIQEAISEARMQMMYIPSIRKC